MKKFYFFAALLAGTVLTSCTSEDDLALSPPETAAEEVNAPIVFSSLKSNITRGDLEGAEAAEKLGSMFVVSGYKGSQTEWDASKNSIVFDNYLVTYKENTANTSESNSDNWEYVGVEGSPIAHATANGITKQSIKYWDFSQDQYDFIAWSTGSKNPVYNDDATLGENDVRVSAITPSTATVTPFVAYTFEGTAANLSECYIADLVTVKKGNATDGFNYGKPVTIKFRQLGTKVRIALYETVPGYSVKDVKFYTAADVALADEGTDDDDANAAAALQNSTATLFTTTANQIFTEGIYTVYFPTVDDTEDSDNNQAHIKFEAIKETVTGEGGEDVEQEKAQATTVDWGGLNYTIRESGEKSEDKIYLGRTSNTASFAGIADDNYYKVFLPNQEGTNLNLRVNYTLESVDGSGETIEVKGATAQVPLIYTTWKPGYAYTYLFKISNKTNGHTGDYDPLYPDDVTVNSDPAGLYPITFDAVVVNAEDGDQTQETITLVSTPSITTYQEGSNVVNNNEYTAGNAIYVTVNDGTTDNTPDLAHGSLQRLTRKVRLYTIATGTTEAEVIDALQMQDDDNAEGAAEGTITGRNKVVLTPATYKIVNEIKYGVDGNTIDVSTAKAARFIPEDGTTYAFVYIKSAAEESEDKVIYEPLAFDKFAAGQTKYRYDYAETAQSHTQTDDKGTEDTSDDVTNTYYDAQKGEKYFTRTGAGTEASPYTYERVVDPFIGQGVGNLYLDNQGNTIATGYAVSGTTYYYTVDGGQHYIEATNVAIEDFAGNTEIGTMSGTTWTANDASLTKPADNTAYYKRTVKSGSGTAQDPFVYSYTYCVFLPLQVNDMFTLDTDNYVEAEETTAVAGQTYFDKYTKNNGVYYTKVIKVQ